MSESVQSLCPQSSSDRGMTKRHGGLILPMDKTWIFLYSRDSSCQVAPSQCFVHSDP